MTQQDQRHNRVTATWRAISVFCLVLWPAISQGLLATRGLTAMPPGTFAVSVSVFAAVFSLTLDRILPAKSAAGILLHILIHAIALALMPGAGAVGYLIPAGHLQAPPRPALIMAWIAGSLLAHLSGTGIRVLGRRGTGSSHALLQPLHLAFATISLTTGFWLIATLALPGHETPFTISRALLALGLTGLSLSITLLLCLAITVASDQKQLAPRDLTPLILTVAAAAAIWFLTRIATGTASVAALIPLLPVTALMAVFLRRRFTALMLSGTMLFLAVPLVTDLLITAPASQPALLLLLAVLPYSIMRTSRRSGSERAGRASAPTAAVLAAFSGKTTSWLAHLDLEKRVIQFPFGVGMAKGRAPPIPFDQVFRDSSTSGVLDLLRQLQTPARPPPSPLRLQLRIPGSVTGPDQQIWQAFEVHVLESTPPRAWIALLSIAQENARNKQQHNSEKRLSEAVLREEWLIARTAQDLRRPVSVLIRLEEELNQGAKWQDLGGIMGQTIRRIADLVDDLRVASNAPPDADSLTPSGLITQLLEVFGPLAARNGIMIEASTPSGPDLPIPDVFGRIFIAMSKLLHNAISHSGGSTVRLEVIAGRGEKDEPVLTWHVSDDGIGLPEPIRKNLDKPPAISQPGGEGGLGLFTAAQAVGSLGGEMRLIETGKGCHFVLIHPLGDTSRDISLAAQPECAVQTSAGRHYRRF